MLKPTTNHLFVVARGDEIVGEPFADRETAERQLRHVNETSVAIGLEPSAVLATVEQRITYRNFEHIIEDAAELPVDGDEPADDSKDAASSSSTAKS